MRGETPLVAKVRADRGTIHNVPVLMLVAAVVILAGVVVVAVLKYGSSFALARHG